MSRSQPALTNPSRHFFEWKGGEGKLEFYDKEKQQRINVPLPFEFLVLDQLATITGYSKLAKNSYYSNEVRNTAKEEFTVKLKGQTVFTGFYKNDQGIAQMPKGANYAKSIYIAHKTRTGEYIIGNIKAAGSALGAWIEFSNTCKVENGKVVIKKGAMQTSPVGDFYPPEFEYIHSTPDEDVAAIALDKELQIYLSHYFAATPVDNEPVIEENSEAQPVDLPKDSLDAANKFDQTQADREDDAAIEAYQQTAQQKDDVIIEDIGEEPINLDDIPF